jgi:RNA polymerase sigma-70 factor (ECF subfamily)
MRQRDLHSSPNTQATSLSLLESAKLRDPESWARLVELYSPLVFFWCQRASLDPEDAADVVQEVFRAVARNLDRFERSSRSGSFRGWLVTITTNKIRDLARRKARQPAAVGGSDYQQFLTRLPDELESDASRATADSLLVRRAVELVSAEFEPRTWQAFWQTAVESRSTDDVGRQLEMSVVAVRKAKSRVLRRLREVLGEEV